MTECEEFEALIVARISGSLTLPETRRLTEHLSSCPECRDEVKALDATIASVALPPIADAELKTLDEIPNQTLRLWKKTQQRRRLFQTATIAASAAAAALILFLLPARHSPLHGDPGDSASAQIADFEFDEAINIAEPLSAALIDSEMAWNLSPENDIGDDGFGMDL